MPLKIKSMNHFRIICMFFLLMLSFQWATAQYEDEVIDAPSIRGEELPPRDGGFFDGVGEHLFVGGNFQLRLGFSTIIEASPYVGYRPADFFAVGVGVPYIFLQDNLNQYRANISGYRLFARLKPFTGDFGFLGRFYAHFEYERLQGRFVDLVNQQLLAYQRYRATYIGPGMTTNFGQGWGFTAELLFNLTSMSQRALFNSLAIYRIGVYYGF